jgi:hypothetical protein
MKRLHFIFLFIGTFAIVLTFQNCSPQNTNPTTTSTGNASQLNSDIRQSSNGDPQPTAQMVKFNLSGAKCNDGSPAAYYFRPGTGKGANRWVIWLQGGGGCGSSNHLNVSNEKKYSCPLRAVTGETNLTTALSQILTGQSNSNTLISSQNYLNIADESLFKGILSKKPNENPDFYSYNHVAIPYCSSDLWSASGQFKKWTDANPNNKWYYQGRNIIQQTISDLITTKNLNSATHLIWSGESAGGMGAAQNAIEVKKMIPSNIDMIALIDGIFELPEKSPVTNTVEAINVMNTFMNFTGATPTQECLSQNGNSISTCVQIKNVLQSLRQQQIPYFITRDQFDIILNYYANTVDSCTSNASILSWMENHAQILRQELSQNQFYSGVYSTRSAQHTWTGNAAWASLKKQTSQGELVSASTVFANWYFNRSGTKIFIQEKPPGQTNLKADYSIDCSKVSMPNN